MALTVEAVYENGVLKPTSPLPLQDQDRVQLTIHTRSETSPSRQRGFGIARWTGSVEDLDYLIEDGENDVLEAT